ncbi:hypothetical protein AVEN_176382-1 [Araneus ventricosus]|uniref:Uncharacterized protein n=1 Tax=Araneus ventricosus TaxID=182803 RepID=A0A4Y2C9W9_ARAVE|nr:hypothetical protein AVEN_176382-1 [Araneus ventricosus]
MAAPSKSIHYRSLRFPIASASPLAFKERIQAGSDFLGECFECNVLLFSHSRESPAALWPGSPWNGWISRLVQNPNFRAHRSNSQRFFTLMTGFGVERPNFS